MEKNKMRNAPVYYVLAQAKFNPIAAMGNRYINEIQDQLRRAGYTLFEQRNFSQIRFDNSPDIPPQILQSTQWLINKEDRTSGFILDTSSLTYHTTHYETSNEFIPAFLDGLKIVNNIVELDHINRLGMRYLDAILPLSNEVVNEYLVKGLHGMDFQEKKEYTLTESVFQTNSDPIVTKGKLIIRILQLPSSLLGYPPDLLPHGLVPMKRFEIKDPCPHALIDTDHFVEGHMPIDFNKIKSQLISLHTVNKKAFESVITPHANKIWS